jgi:hypothetical protein
MVYREIAVGSRHPHERPIIETARYSAAAKQAYRLQAHVRRGTGSGLRGTWSNYATIEDARQAARELLREERVLRATVVTDTVPPRFVEWVNR